MGGSRHTESGSEYLYYPQKASFAFHETPPAAAHRAAQESAPALLCPPSSNLLQSPHPTLLLNPLVSLVHLNNFYQKYQLVTQPPTGIVSQHPPNPNAERDLTRNGARKQPVKSAQSRQKLNGNNSSKTPVHAGGVPMTPVDASGMGSIREEEYPYPLSQRPSIVSHNSSSVPSTPHQYPREFVSRSRSPSPNGGLGSHSPRSVSSEANGHLPTLRKPRQGCKYETNVAFGRRRIPYTSSDTLEKAKEEPKKALDPHEEKKLSGDMRELYDRILPTPESEQRRVKFVQKLENLLRREWPGYEFKVHVFGSSGNLLCTSESDVDVCIQTPMKKLESMHILAEALAKHGMEKVVCVPSAKVPIVKIWDPELQLACDMNVNNTMALENTRMIKTYVQIDERSMTLGGTISSYTWICMILNFLQTRDPPILPSLHHLPYRKAIKETGEQSDFADDLEKLQGFGHENKETVGQLLFHFFRRYGHEIDYEKSVISVRQGRLLSRKEKGWDLDSLTREARNRLCVEEPFNTYRNLGNSADDFAWRGIHLELRLAFTLLADGGQLDKACEQYEFPPEEKVVFKRPTPAPKPILTSSTPAGRGGRGGAGQRGGRGSFHQKNSQYQRRASSGASFNNGRPPFLHSPPIGVNGQVNGQINGQDYFVRGLNDQLHDQLYQQYQLLEMQSNSLRAQLMAQQRAQQHAHMQAHAINQVQAQAQQARGQLANGSPQKSPYMNGRSSPRTSESMPTTGAIPPSLLLYHYPGYYDFNHSMASSTSQDGSRTNPSSPSLTSSIPGLRRGVHRTSAASDTGSIRSQSQPARTVPNSQLPTGYPPPPYPEPNAFAGYPIARSTVDAAPNQSSTEPPYSPMTTFPESAVSSDHGTPKEYVGYYVHDSPKIPPEVPDYSVPQIPSYSELAQRRRRVSPEIVQPLLNSTLRRVSRSPSPLSGHLRSYSTGVTPPLGPKPQQRIGRGDLTPTPEGEGLVIANGSYPTKPRETRAMSESVDMTNTDTTSKDPSALGIYMPTGEQYRFPTSSEQRQQQLYADALLQRHNAAEFSRSEMSNGVGAISSADPNTLTRVPSGPRQPFPQLPEPLLNHYGSLNGDSTSDSADVSPTRNQQQWRGGQLPNGISPLDTKALRAPPQEIKSAGLPLLSPVFETRTPSPTVSRQMEIAKQQLLNGTMPTSKENQQPLSFRAAQNSKEAKAGQPKKDPPPNDKSNRGSPSDKNQSGTWQQSNSQKRRKKQSKSATNQKQGIETKLQGEPLPVNEADRKGG
ncbi:uncharacterized protein BDZ99DRAFT_452531 [Mytilinidion resinicola]|uniref:polynucleotide adenylyltransferase n=1 Tax=Mytilinidion resinicola TaxID=574789 RepID=A0A6A6Y5X6_9PEZI|nr:uncharacterized protein BDZ99DRAFT_452531 [Mytilinidion resinicola]KAF2804029.1 hypothetical protein BDZ99DRAFT_452531 [Mytilinidion resinicola]